MPHPTPSILIVEDDRATLDLYELILRREGYAVRTAVDLPALLVEVERAVPDAILLDFHLASGTSLDLLRRLRDSPRTRQVPVAVVTADYLLEDTVPRDLEALGVEISFKPLWEDELVRLAGELIARDGR